MRYYASSQFKGLPICQMSESEAGKKNLKCTSFNSFSRYILLNASFVLDLKIWNQTDCQPFQLQGFIISHLKVQLRTNSSLLFKIVATLLKNVMSGKKSIFYFIELKMIISNWHPYWIFSYTIAVAISVVSKWPTVKVAWLV